MDSFDMGENMGVMVLQGVIIVLAIIIVFMIYSEKSTADDLQSKIDSFECPACPSCPECPDCNCSDAGGECPACICENESTPLDCPDCPECPKTSGPSVDDIVNAIFPGRNPGMTSHGRFFSYDDFTESQLKSTFEAVDDLQASTAGGGIPARVNFEKRFTNGSSNDVATASQVDPPMGSGAGVFSEPSEVAGNESVSPPATPPATPPASPTASATATPTATATPATPPTEETTA